MKHFATPEFWVLYDALAQDVRGLADKNFILLKADANHPSLRFRRVGQYWSARVGLHYRVLARERPEGFVWFWIGSHAVYDALIRQA